MLSKFRVAAVATRTPLGARARTVSRSRSSARGHGFSEWRAGFVRLPGLRSSASKRLTRWRKTRLPVRHQLCQSRPHHFLVFPRGTAMALHVGVWLSLLPWRSSPQQWAPALCPNYVKCILTVNFVGGHGAGGGRARFAPLLCVLLNNTQPILSPKCEMRILRGVPIYSRF